MKGASQSPLLQVSPLTGKTETTFASPHLLHCSPDPWYVQIPKRLLALLPLFAMIFSTISQIFSIAKNIAAKTSIEDYYDKDVLVTSNGFTAAYSCDYGNADAVVVYCPFDTMGAFEAILGVWVGYFFLFVCVRLWATASFATNDLRFVLAGDWFNSHRINTLLVSLGYALTTVSVVISFYYMSPQTDWNPNIDTPNLLSLIVFFGINVVSLSRFRRQFVTQRLSPVTELVEVFPSYLPMRGERTALDFLRPTEDVLEPYGVAYIKYLKRNDPCPLLQLIYHDEVVFQEDASAEVAASKDEQLAKLLEALNRLYGIAQH